MHYFYEMIMEYIDEPIFLESISRNIWRWQTRMLSTLSTMVLQFVLGVFEIRQESQAGVNSFTLQRLAVAFRIRITSNKCPGSKLVLSDCQQQVLPKLVIICVKRCCNCQGRCCGTCSLSMDTFLSRSFSAYRWTDGLDMDKRLL